MYEFQQDKIIRLNTDKDETDLEYALLWVINNNDFKNHKIAIINNMLGRIDHILGVLYLLEIDENRISIMNNKASIFLSSSAFEISLPINSTLSLIPISEEVKDIYTNGLLYNLNGDSLHRNKTRGLSNKNLDKIVTLNFSVGKLIIVVNN